MLRQPTDEVRKIYRHAGIEFSGPTEQAVTSASTGNVKDRHGKHVYSLSGFGLDADQVGEQFDFYKRAFQIPDEHAGMAGIR